MNAVCNNQIIASIQDHCIFLSSENKTYDDLAVRIDETDRFTANTYSIAVDMPLEIIKKKILDEWKLDHIEITDNLVKAASDGHKYCCDVWNGVIVGGSIKFMANINPSGKNSTDYVQIDKNGIKRCKKLFDTFEDFVSSCKDVRVFELLAIKNADGKYRIDGFKDYPKEMYSLFIPIGAYFFIEQMWELV